MATRKENTENYAENTGRSWTEWLTFLDGINARDLSHTEIAKRVKDTGEVTGWWSQSITVAYEQHIGRRLPGQRADGSFEVSVTRKLDGMMDDVMARWAKSMAGREEIGGTAAAKESETSNTGKRCYWRLPLKDKSKVVVITEPKETGKVLLTVVHEKLPSPEAVEQWRAVWKDEVQKL